MAKAKTIDRLALTKQNSAYLRDRDKKHNPPEIHNEPMNDIPPEPEIHGDVCPMCGNSTLQHMEGCATCLSCGWSKCGIK